MIKKSKRIIVSLLIVLTLVSVLPCTQTFATSKDGVQQKYNKVNGKMTFQYFLNGNLLTNQWYEYDDQLINIDKDGVKTLVDNHHKIYLDENGCQAHGWRVIDGETYYLGAKGVTMLKGESGKFEKYVFDDDGKIITDPVKVKYSGKEYTIAADGKSVTMTVDGEQYNVPKDESLANDKIVEKDGKYYHASWDIDYAHIYHILKSSYWRDYYAKEDGTLAANEWIYVCVNKAADKDYYSWRYYGADMKNVKGYQTINGKKYYFNKNGNMQIGWKMRVKNENFDGTQEAARNDSLSKDKLRYYYGEDGVIKEGWVNSKGKSYYIYSDGLMATNTTTPDGYWVNKDGVCKS